MKVGFSTPNAGRSTQLLWAVRLRCPSTGNLLLHLPSQRSDDIDHHGLLNGVIGPSLMLGPTGSFYLDTPDIRPPTGDLSNRARAVTAAVLVFIGISSMVMAALLSVAHFMFSDATPALSAIDAVISDPVAHAELQNEIGNAIADQLVGSETSSRVSIYGLDVRERSVELAGAVLDDPSFRTTLNNTINDAHAAIFNSDRSVQLDLSALTQSIVDVIAVQSNQINVLIDPTADIATINAADLPDLSAAMGFVDRLLLISLVGLVGIPLAAIVHPRSHRVLSWTGRLLLLLGFVGFAVVFGGPPLAGRMTGWAAAEIALRTVTVRFMIPTAIIAMTGVGFLSVAAVVRHRESTANASHGAVAALGIGQESGGGYLPSPAELAGPRLVGAGQRLTNI